ncbi:MAG: hypothetical protein Q4P71_09220 [Actinomycetaceae bacterium]|nr:hypothetical protein [Actinomycetaceae bacterium]
MSYHWIFAPLALPFITLSLPAFGFIVAAGVISTALFIQFALLLPWLIPILIGISARAMWINRAPIILTVAQTIVTMLAVFTIISFFLSADHQGQYAESSMLQATLTLVIGMVVAAAAGYIVTRRRGLTWTETWEY